MLSDGSTVKVHLTNCLDFGSEGIVYQGKLCATNQSVAIKCIKNWQEQIVSLKETLEFCKQLRHPHIVGHLHHQEYRPKDQCEPPLYQVIMELCRGGTLRQILRRIVITPYLLQKWTQEIVEGVAYLHGMHCVHRDIKGANILMTSRNVATSSVKIADLTTMAIADNVPPGCGTYPFMAPEMMADQNPATDEVMPTRGPPADIWSLGCVVIEMLNGTSPQFFREHNGKKVQIEDELPVQLFVLTGGFPTIPAGLPPDIELFIRECLQRDPRERKSATELKSSSFLTSGANTLLHWILPEPICGIDGPMELREFSVGTQRIIPVVLLRMVARGTGHVYLAERTDTGDTVAVKSILLDIDPEIRKDKLKQFEAELRILMPAHHPNIVTCIHHQEAPMVSVSDPPTYQILMEFCEGPTLSKFLKETALPPSLLQKWIKQLVDGISYLHSLHCVHGDITSSNILLSSNDVNNCLLKIGGFGAIKRLQGKKTRTKEVPHQRGTSVCMSPEMITGEQQDEDGDQEPRKLGRKTDIWNLGCLVIELVTGKLPEYHKKRSEGKMVKITGDMAVMYFVGTGGAPTVPESLPPKLDSFVSQCIQRDPTDRPRDVDLKRHAFITANQEELSSWVLPSRTY